MALDLQIKTGDAVAQIKLISQNLEQLRKTLDSFPTTTKLTHALNSLNNFPGIDQRAISSIEQMANAITKLNNVKDISAVARGLKSLETVNVGAVATNVSKLVAEINRLGSTASFDKLVGSLGRYAAAANVAVSATRNLSGAIASIKAPTVLTQATANLSSLAQGMGTAGTAATNLGGSLSSLSGLLAGFGVTLGAVGIGRFVSAMTDAQRELVSFRALTDTTLASFGGSARAMEFMKKTALDLALPLDVLQNSYAKFATVVTQSGQSIDNTEKIFRDLSTALAGIGAGSVQANRAFKAVEQMFNKGGIQAEELKQQLGEVLPATQSLAKSMGVSMQELYRLMEAGAVGTEHISGMVAELANLYGGAAAIMREKVGGAINQVTTAWTLFTQSFGEGFFEQVTPALLRFAEALRGLSGEDIKSAGAAIGFLAARVVDLGTMLVQFAGTDVGQFVISIGSMGAALLAATTAFSLFRGALGLLLGGPLATLGSLFTGSAAAASTLIPALGSIVASFGSFGTILISTTALFTPFNAALAAAGLAIGALIAYMSETSTATEDMGKSTEGASEGFNTLTGAVTSLDEALKVAKNATDASKVSHTNLEAAAEVLAGTMVELEGHATAANKAFEEGEISLEDLQSVVGSIDKEWNRLADELNKVVKAENDANAAAQALGDGVLNTANKSGSLVSVLDNLTSSMWNYVEAARAAASAGGPSSGGGGGSSTGTGTSGGGETSFGDSMFADEFAGGGIAGQARRHRLVPRSAFAGAPHFQDGTANTSGGIPSILHSNEAVVPLAGGGQIPVQMNSGGQVAYLSKILEVEQGSKVELGRIWTAVNTQTVITKDKLDNIYDVLVGMNGTMGSMSANIKTMLSKMEQIAKDTQRMLVQAQRDRGTGGTGTSTSGGTGTSISGGNNMGLNDNGLVGGGFAGGLGGTGAFWNNGSVQLHGFGDGGIGLNDAGLNRPSPLTGYDFRNGEYYGGGSTSNSSNAGNGPFTPGGGFARGTPNTSRDGMPVIVHPDEAIIPLPDGRKVPVQLPDAIMDQMASMAGGYSSGSSMTSGPNGTTYNDGTRRSQGGGGNNFNIVINVQSPDAEGFRRSQDQIVQDLKLKLDRVASRFGENPRSEDPTRRAR